MDTRKSLPPPLRATFCGKLE